MRFLATLEVFFMAISWEQVEDGAEIRSKIVGYSKPKFLHIEYKTVIENGQRTFALQVEPTSDLVKLYINHLCYYEDGHFNVNRNSLASSVTWFYTKANNGFDIDTNDRVYIEYWSYNKV